MAKWRSAKAERAHLTAVMRAEGKSWAEIAHDFRDRYGVNARVAMRLAHGWSQVDVAREWSKRWPDNARTDQNVSTWERWPESGHTPSLNTLIKLAEIYECDLSDLVVDLGCYSYLDDVHAQTGTAADPVRPIGGSRRPDRADSQAEAEAVVDRFAGLSTNPALLPAASPLDVAAVRAMSDAFRAADRRLGGGVLYASVTRYLSAEVAPHLLTPTSQAPDTQLFTAAASLTEAAGWMAHDGGGDDLARLHFTRAFKLASVAGDDALIANVCASMSHLASQLGEPHEAVRLADKGLRQTGQKPLTAQLIARLYAMRALGLASRSEAQACLGALNRAERALAAYGARDVGWVSHFDEGSLAIETARCLRRLGDFREAEHQARRAIDLRKGDRVRSRAFAQLTLARVLADGNRIDEAASIGTAVCRTASTLASTRVVHQLDRLKFVIADRSAVAEVAEFVAALADLQQSTRSPEQPTPWPT